jgi:hypothetical protein
LLHVQTRFAKAMGDGILVDFLQVPMTVIDMNVISNLSNQITIA